MSSSQDNHAVEIFWQLPELQENLLSFLDPRSILNLAKAFPPIVNILKKESRVRKLMWARLMDNIGMKMRLTLKTQKLCSQKAKR